jgi:hypothetical protein
MIQNHLCTQLYPTVSLLCTYNTTTTTTIIVTNCISFYLYITLTDPLGLHNNIIFSILLYVTHLKMAHM